MRGSKDIGDMTVIREIKQNQVYYDIKSKVEFRILFSFTVDYQSQSEYKDGRLIKEFTHNQLNGASQKKSTIWFDGEKYTLDLNGIRSYETGSITFSVAAIYYNEPTHLQKVFSPQFARYLKFKQINEHQYELDSPDGVNTYTYLNGICTRVDVNRDFARFSFVMTEKSLEVVKNFTGSGTAPTVD